jgi:hypothetical protein
MRSTLRGLAPGTPVRVAHRGRRGRGTVVRVYDDAQHGPCVSWRSTYSGGVYSAPVALVRAER